MQTCTVAGTTVSSTRSTRVTTNDIWYIYFQVGSGSLNERSFIQS